ncbi:MAG: glycosyltransferase family 39 protein [Anaerolineae bacterium]|nr:glycosyltransferase family 39 protein [Anaerolineae bacterium]
MLINAPYERLWIGLILAIFVFLALGFSLGALFEGPDEAAHYNFVRYVQANRNLPPADGDPYGQFHQAPLYYLLMQPLAILFPDPNFDRAELRENPNHAYDITRFGNDNKNLYLHTRDEAFPYRTATARAVHVMRLASVLMGAITVWLAYRVTCFVWSEHPYRRILTVAIVAFWPQFIYLSSLINNDNLMFLMGTASLLLMLQQQANPTWKRAAILGLVLGAALLTKASMGLLAIPIGIATIIDKRLWKYAILTALLTIAIGGWWYVRNYVTYGDWFGFNAMFIAWSNQAINPDGSPDFAIGLSRSVYAYSSVWARFGQGAIAMPLWIYRVFDYLLIIAGIGLIGRFIRGWKNRQTIRVNVRQSVFIAAFALVWIGSIISAASVATAGNQGRYLFPGIVAWGMILALGIDTWFIRIPRAIATAIVCSLLIITSLTALFVGFYPSYRALPVPDEIARPLGIRYEDTAELLGISPLDLQGYPGETITVELYWRALESAAPTLQMYLHAINGEDVLWRDSIPGNGNRPADDWQPDETWSERYVVTLPVTLEPDTNYILVAGLFDPTTGTALEAFDGAGNSLSNTPFIANLTIIAKP